MKKEFVERRREDNEKNKITKNLINIGKRREPRKKSRVIADRKRFDILLLRQEEMIVMIDEKMI